MFPGSTTGSVFCHTGGRSSLSVASTVLEKSGHSYVTLSGTPNERFASACNAIRQRFDPGGGWLRSQLTDKLGCRPNRQSGGKRRWWESNPLRPGCSRLPGRLAPASMEGLSREIAGLSNSRRPAGSHLCSPAFQLARPGVEPGLTASRAAVRIHHTHGLKSTALGLRLA